VGRTRIVISVKHVTVMRELVHSIHEDVLPSEQRTAASVESRARICGAGENMDETSSSVETRFDFIGDERFRESLRSDFNEMTRCVEAEAWKSVHALAGSIVEALLEPREHGECRTYRGENCDHLQE